MKRIIQKELSVFLSLLMLMTTISVMQFADTGVFSVNAATERK